MSDPSKREIEHELHNLRTNGGPSYDPLEIDEKTREHLDAVFGPKDDDAEPVEAGGGDGSRPEELTREEKDRLSEAFEVEPET